MRRTFLKKAAARLIVDSGWLWGSARVKRLLGQRAVTILMYHRVAGSSCNDPEARIRVINAHCEQFKQQAEFLARTCTVLSFDELREYCLHPEKLPENPVILTFDDGYLDNYTVAFPILRQYGLKATIALTTGFIGTRQVPWWDRLAEAIIRIPGPAIRIKGVGMLDLTDKFRVVRRVQEQVKLMAEKEKNRVISELESRLPEPPPSNTCMLSWEHVREMGRQGISFAAHTVTHPILTRVDRETAREEILRSRQTVEQQTGKPVTVFSYPNGSPADMNAGLDDFIKQAGFQFCLTTLYGSNPPGPDLFKLKRVIVEPDDDLRLFQVKVAGFGSRLAKLYKKLGKL